MALHDNPSTWGWATASACRARLYSCERLLRVDERSPAVGRLVGVVTDQRDHLVGDQFRINREDLRGQVHHLRRGHRRARLGELLTDWDHALDLIAVGVPNVRRLWNRSGAIDPLLPVVL